LHASRRVFRRGRHASRLMDTTGLRSRPGSTTERRGVRRPLVARMRHRILFLCSGRRHAVSFTMFPLLGWLQFEYQCAAVINGPAAPVPIFIGMMRMVGVLTYECERMLSPGAADCRQSSTLLDIVFLLSLIRMRLRRQARLWRIRSLARRGRAISADRNVTRRPQRGTDWRQQPRLTTQVAPDEDNRNRCRECRMIGDNQLPRASRRSVSHSSGGRRHPHHARRSETGAPGRV